MLKGVLLISLLELLPDAVLAMKCEKLDEFLFQKVVLVKQMVLKVE